MLKLPLLLAPLALAGVAAPVVAHAPDAGVPAARPTGKPINCLRLTDIRDTKVRSDSVIDFTLRGGQVYRNTLPMSCPSLGFEQRYVHRSPQGEICSVDTITVARLTPVAQGATCRIGQFQPVELTPGG